MKFPFSDGSCEVVYKDDLCTWRGHTNGCFAEWDDRRNESRGIESAVSDEFENGSRCGNSVHTSDLISDTFVVHLLQWQRRHGARSTRHARHRSARLDRVEGEITAVIKHVRVDDDWKLPIKSHVFPTTLCVNCNRTQSGRKLQSFAVIVYVDNGSRAESKRRHHGIQPDGWCEAPNDQHVRSGPFAEGSCDTSVAVRHVVGYPRGRNGIDIVGKCDQHDVSPGHADAFGERTSEIDSTMWSESERSSRRHFGTGVGQTTLAWITRAATELKRNDDAVARFETRHTFTKTNNLADHFVTHHERPLHRVQADGDCGIEVAARNSQRPHQGIARVEDSRCLDVFPFEVHRTAEHQCLHERAPFGTMLVVIETSYEGRHSQMSRSDVRNNMVQGAIELLAAHGVHGTSFALLIEATNAPRGSIYHHFPGGKSELIRDAVLSIGASVTSIIDGLDAKKPEDVVTAFVEGWRALLVSGNFDRGCAVAATSLGAGDESELRDAARDVFAAWTSSLTDAFVRAGVRRSEAADYASLSIAVVEGALVLGRTTRTDEIFQIARRQLTTLVTTSR